MPIRCSRSVAWCTCAASSAARKTGRFRVDRRAGQGRKLVAQRDVERAGRIAAAEGQDGSDVPALTGDTIEPSTNRRTDMKAVGGGSLVGIGWGIGGHCPGPALLARGGGRLSAAIVVGGMRLGMSAHDGVAARQWRCRDKGWLWLLRIDCYITRHPIGRVPENEVAMEPGFECVRRRSGLARAMGIALLAICAGPAFPASLSAEQMAASGTGAGAPACAGCHGAHGEGMPAAGFPELAGLDAKYLQDQLADLADGRRDSAVMSPIAKLLKPDEVQALAAWYAHLSPPASEAQPRQPATPSTGEVLANHGDWSRGLPACNQCHGPRGSGVGDVFPRIAGQSAAYISAQLKAWQAGTRHNDPLGLMRVISTKLSASEVDSVAAYFASLQPPADASPTKVKP
jgi:cytochrome c553